MWNSEKRRTRRLIASLEKKLEDQQQYLKTLKTVIGNFLDEPLDVFSFPYKDHPYSNYLHHAHFDTGVYKDELKDLIFTIMNAQKLKTETDVEEMKSELLELKEI